MDFSKTEFIKSVGFSDDLCSFYGSEIVFSGRSNVGKSSLINKLCNRKSLARVSSSPGKTTTINYFRISQDYYLVDLPGYGYAKRSDVEKERWAALMENYFQTSESIALVLQLLDCRHEPSDDDKVMLNYLHQSGLPYIAVLTKTDKLNKTELSLLDEKFSKLLKRYCPLEIIPFSANSEDCAVRLRNRISELAEQSKQG